MWKFEYPTIDVLRVALAAERGAVEARLSEARAFSSFKGRGPSLYIVYLRDFPSGPFSIKEPYEWPRTDIASMKVVVQAAFSNPVAVSLYAHYLLSAKNARGELISPAGRVDLLLGRRLATALPEDHPARHGPPTLKTVDPILFYENPDDDSEG